MFSFNVYSSYFVKVTPRGGAIDYVGEVDRIEIHNDNRVAICCDTWYSTVNKNKVQGGCFYLDGVTFIDFDTFFGLLGHHIPTPYTKWTYHDSNKVVTVEDTMCSRNTPHDIEMVTALADDLGYLHRLIAGGFSSCCELDFCMRLLSELAAKIKKIGW